MFPQVTNSTINDFKPVLRDWATGVKGIVLDHKSSATKKTERELQCRVNNLLMKDEGICRGFGRYRKENNKGFKDFIYSFQKGGTNGMDEVSEEMIDKIYDFFVPLDGRTPIEDMPIPEWRYEGRTIVHPKTEYYTP
jgi:hypothetical protein